MSKEEVTGLNLECLPIGMIIFIVCVFLNLISVGHIYLKILYTLVVFNKIIYDHDNGVGLADGIRVVCGK